MHGNHYIQLKNYSLCSNLFSCLKNQIFLGNIIYCLIFFIKMYNFSKLPLNKFISFFFLKSVILNKATKNVSQLDDFLKYLLVLFQIVLKIKFGYNRNISKLITSIFRNRTIFWDIPK